MKTNLSPEKLAELHAEGRTNVTRFIDPAAVYRCQRILRERGEGWAASVLLRRLDRRSLISASFPWLNQGELETLLLADDAEWAATVDSLREF